MTKAQAKEERIIHLHEALERTLRRENYRLNEIKQTVAIPVWTKKQKTHKRAKRAKVWTQKKKKSVSPK